jgi:uncharacterized protein YcbX
VAHIVWISIAPVKGLALTHRQEITLEPFGARENRRFHLIGEDGRLLNGKQLGPLVQISADWDEETNVLALHFPDGTSTVAAVELGQPVVTKFYGRDVHGHLVLGPWADALSAFLGLELRLVQPDVPGTGNDRGEGSVSLLSTASLASLSATLDGAPTLDPRRFRMLFGVAGVDPHEEDTWLGRRVRIGDAAVRVRGNVGRCIVTSRDPDTGARTVATLDALAEYRHGVETTEPLPFGVWGEVAEPGRVRLGDPVVPEGSAA